MPNKARFQPMPDLATEVALDQALRPFIDRFVVEDKRARALSLYVPNKTKHEWRGLIALIDKQRGRTYSEAEIKPWQSVRGVFLVDKEAYSVDAKTAMQLYVTTEAIFVAYGATFAIVDDHHGKLLLT